MSYYCSVCDNTVNSPHNDCPNMTTPPTPDSAVRELFYAIEAIRETRATFEDVGSPQSFTRWKDALTHFETTFHDAVREVLVTASRPTRKPDLRALREWVAAGFPKETTP